MSYDRVEEGVLNWNICLVRVNVMKLELVSDCSCHAYSASRILASSLQ